ncbi:rhamnan synthesis F family protein [Paenibacillus cellulositrophicus]|uniref:rhamnan synthesis F family protein n=1 Tax=Paenibacillus cellulositrophicus TaxID=562959 RepID=UPI003F80FCBE
MDFSGERFVPGKAFGQIEVEHMQRYQAVAKIVSGKVVLDAACGEGYGSDLLARNAEEVIGIDISKEAIEWASEHYKRKGLEFLQNDITTLPFPDNYFDVVVSFETIEHVDSRMQESFLFEIRRVLKDNGLLIISTPNKLIYSDATDFKNPYHIKEFYTNEFSQFLGKFFENIKMFVQKNENVMLLESITDTLENKSIPYFGMKKEEINNIGIYNIAVCSNEPIGNLNDLENITLLDNQKYESDLYVDFGGGFSEEVKVPTEITINKEGFFSVSFLKLSPLKNIIKLKWVPVKKPIKKLKISSYQLNISNSSIELRIENTDNQIDQVSGIIISGNLEGLDFIHLEGIILFADAEDVNKSWEAKYMSNEKRYNLEINKLLEENKLKTNTLEQTIQNINDEKKQLQTLNCEINNEVVNLKVKVEELLDNIESLNFDIENSEKIKDQILQDLERKNQENLELIQRLAIVESEKNELDKIVNEVFSSNSWKITAPAREMGRLSKKILKKSVKKIISNNPNTRKILKKMYHKFPLSIEKKIRLKNYIYTKYSFLFSDTLMYKAWLASSSPITKETKYRNNTSYIYDIGNDVLQESPGLIAIQVHLYYVDLMNEFITYLNNIPYQFDLLISITDKKSKEIVKNEFSKIENVKNVFVEVVPNRGRDVAPLVVNFAEKIMKYDFICHIHTKKSLYTGNEQTYWRKYLLDNLMGSEEVVRKIFYLFQKGNNVGLIYPETVSFIPYWGHTWLANKDRAKELLKCMGINIGNTNYIDYPAGTMFWARTKALQPLFKLGLKIGNFDEESKQTDGTLAHAIERSIVPITIQQNMTFFEVNFEKGVYRVGKGSRNLIDYWNLNFNVLLEFIFDKLDIDVVSFDVFDTLITRPLIDPNSAFDLINNQIRGLGINIDYVSIRKNAELNVRLKKNFIGDCDIDEIYDEFCNLSNLDKETSEKIKNIEISNEINLSLPRYEVVKLLKELFRRGIKIVLISDMYLKEDHVISILNKHGISEYHELWISSKTGIRKDSGEVWDKYADKYRSLNPVHIGDNERSDIQIPTEKGIYTIHTMNGKSIFENTEFGNFLLGRADEKNWSDSAILGLITSKYLNNPYVLNETEGKFILSDFKKLGYSIFGPVFVYFFTWLLKRIENEGIKCLLFPAREGYFLKELYDFIISRVGNSNHPSESTYLLASRRAVSVAAIENEDDAVSLLNINFKGNLSDLLYARYGIEKSKVKEEDSINIELPRDYEIVRRLILNKYKDVILSTAREERKNYHHYINSIGLFDAEGSIGIVDLGYSGTIQYYLSRVLNRETKGYYFATSDTQRGIEFPGNTMEGCFADSQDYLSSNSSVYKYQLFLESILTAPHGQIEKIKNNHLDVQYAKEGHSQMIFDSLMEVHKGIKEYTADFLDYFGKYINEFNPSIDLIEGFIEVLLTDNNLLSTELKGIFSVEDNYCSSGEVPVIEFYRDLFQVGV